MPSLQNALVESPCPQECLSLDLIVGYRPFEADEEAVIGLTSSLDIQMRNFFDEKVLNYPTIVTPLVAT